jgi:hypothetical protein
MKLAAAFMCAGFSCCALDISWTPPVERVDGYLLTHWSAGASMIEEYGIGNQTNILYQGTLVDGVNYFAVSSYIYVGGSNLLISGLSVVAIVTNTPAIILKSVTLGSTNLTSQWTPLQTNYALIYPTQPIEFLTTSNSISKTNIVTVPPP